MARTVQSEEERLRRIILVGEHIKKTGDSTRKTASYFTQTYFPISNCTVCDYCARYCKMNPEEVDELRGKITENTVKSVDNPEVKERVLRNGNLLAEGLTVDQIQELTGVDFWIIYRDIHKRLPLVDPDLYLEKVKPILEEHSHSNLKNHK